MYIYIYIYYIQDLFARPQSCALRTLKLKLRIPWTFVLRGAAGLPAEREAVGTLALLLGQVSMHLRTPIQTLVETPDGPDGGSWHHPFTDRKK